MTRKILTAIPALFAFGLATGAASAASIVGLTPENRLITFDSDRPGLARPVPVTGIQGNILGIDVRPADRKLYAVTDSDTIYRVDPETGAATQVSKLSSKFTSGGRAVVDFNPAADRLRLMGANGVNFRIHPDTGAVTTDGKLTYAQKDANAGKKPGVTAGAYTNSMAGVRGTELFNLDTRQGVLVLQSPPNDGVLQTKGGFGTKFEPTTAFDIMPDGSGGNIAYAVSGQTLYTIDLDKGKAKKVRDLKKLPALIDIAVLPAK